MNKRRKYLKIRMAREVIEKDLDYRIDWAFGDAWTPNSNLSKKLKYYKVFLRTNTDTIKKRQIIIIQFVDLLDLKYDIQ